MSDTNQAPVITSGAVVLVGENQTGALTVTSSDVNGGVPTYAIVGGADRARFLINSATGVLTFVAAPDFEVPTDVGSDNVYSVTVQVADGNGGTASQNIAITVTNVNEAPVIPPPLLPPGLPSVPPSLVPQPSPSPFVIPVPPVSAAAPGPAPLLPPLAGEA